MKDAQLQTRNEEIQRLFKEGKKRNELAALFGLSYSYITMITRGDEYIEGMKKATQLKNKEARSEYRKQFGIRRKCLICGDEFIVRAGKQARCEKHKHMMIRPQYQKKEPAERTCFCGAKFMAVRKRVYCDEHYNRIRVLGGRDRNREIVRIMHGDKCDDCKTPWVPGHRRYDIHHKVNCGQRSKSYDQPTDPELMVLCHKCHMANHGLKRLKEHKEKITDNTKRAARALFFAGMTRGEIAKVLNVSQTSVWLWCAGISL